MAFPRLLAIPVALPLLLSAQAPPTAPVVSLRGVVNAYSQLPAPSRIAPGGIIWINGLNLGPVEGAKASGSPLPTELGGIRVLIANREAPLFSASPNRIEAQVPWETPAGSVAVVVRKGEASSRPARINVVPLDPAIRAASAAGFGEAASTIDGDAITLQATGLGLTNPRSVSGEVGSSDQVLVNPLRAFIGGLAAPVSVAPSMDRPGEFDVRITVPSAAQPGDLVNLTVGPGATPATPRRLYRAAATLSLQYLDVPAAAAADILALAASDLRGSFGMAAGARAADGCYRAYRIDFDAKRFSTAEPCVTVGNRNQVNPFTQAMEGAAIAALLGPPDGELPNGVSSKMAVFNPAEETVMRAELPSLALNITSQGGNFRAGLTGTNPPAVLVDAATAEVTPVAAGGGGTPGGPGMGGGGGGVGCLNPAVTIDLGEGLNKILSCSQVGQVFLSVITDDENAPKKAKIAALNAQGQVQNSVDFPVGLLPVVLPAIQIQVPPGGVAPPGGGGLNALAARIRVPSIVDGNVVYIVARAASDASRDTLLAVSGQQQAIAQIPFPAGWFAASCTPQLRIFSLDLARQIGFPASKIAEKDNKQNCPAYGLLLLNRDTRAVSISESPGRDGFNAASQAGDLSDFIYTVSTNPQRPGVAESLYVLDGTNGSSFRLDLPTGVSGFGAVREEQSLLSLIAPANASATGNGDAGLAIFDIESASARLLPTPEGFNAVQILAIFDTTRKIVARGTRPGNSGSALLVYDLVSGDLAMPPNPEGCAFVGTAPAAAPGGGQQAVNLLAVSPKANSILAGCFGANRQLAGFVLLKSN
jgi:uncharacterized protein (TIGR03437 family)